MIRDKIQVKQVEIAVEQDPEKKQELQKQLRKLQLRLELEVIKKKMEQIG